MLNIANFQRNARQNHNEVSPWSEWPISKSLQTTSAGECAEKEKKKPLTLLVVQPVWRTVWSFL